LQGGSSKKKKLQKSKQRKAALQHTAQMASKKRAFFDIDIGDPKEFQIQSEEYSRAQKFFKEVASSYGLGNSLADADHETLLSLYDSDPNRRAQGPIRVVPPVSQRAGRIVFELFDESAPKAVQNFLCLCTGEKGKNKSGKALHYRGSKIHRIEKGLLCQETTAISISTTQKNFSLSLFCIDNLK
jgi:hypothetical protein